MLMLSDSYLASDDACDDGLRRWPPGLRLSSHTPSPVHQCATCHVCRPQQRTANVVSKMYLVQFVSTAPRSSARHPCTRAERPIPSRPFADPSCPPYHPFWPFPLFRASPCLARTCRRRDELQATCHKLGKPSRRASSPTATASSSCVKSSVSGCGESPAGKVVDLGPLDAAGGLDAAGA